MRGFAGFLSLLLAGCASSWGDDYDRLWSEVKSLPVRAELPPEAGSVSFDDAREVDLETLLRIARERNPELREGVSRTRAALAGVRRAGAWDDPMLVLKTEGTPLRQPTSFNRAMENSLGLQQAIPFPGNLGLRSEAAVREAESLHETYRMRERDVLARVTKAYFEYWALERELETHLEHIRLLEEFERVSEARFRTGAVSQQDVLKPQVELVTLQNEVLGTRQRIDSARAALNALLGRPAAAPFGKPKEPAAPSDLIDAQALSARALEVNPDIRAAQFRIRAVKTQLQLAEREAVLPDFGVGVDYMQIPGESDAWAGMLSINLPWLTGKRRAEVRRLEETLRAEEAALETVRTRVLFEVRDAASRVEAARKSLVLFEGELLPKSGQSVEVSRSSYEKGTTSFLDLLDAERSRRDVRLRSYQARAQYASALADLERAAGEDARRKE